MLPTFSVLPTHISFRWLFLTLLVLLPAGNTLYAQNPGQIYDLIIDKKIDKAIERRNKIYENDKKSDLLLIDLCDCILYNSPEYKAFDPEKAYEIFNRALLPNSKERTLIRFLDKKENSLDSIRVQIERNLYNLACQTNSEESYAHFIGLCPQSRWAEEAAGRQEEIAYRQAIEKGTIEGYNHFLAHYATSPHVVEITQLADKTTFAQLDNTIEAYKQFIELYPQSALIEEAHNRIYRLAYAEARKAHTREAYVQLLADYPDHPMKEEAQSAIESFDYLSLTQQPTQYGYDKFLRDYPNSTYIVPLNDWLGHLQKTPWHWSHNNLRGYVKSVQESTDTTVGGKETHSTVSYLYDQLGQLLLAETRKNGKSEEKSYLYHPDFTLNSIATPQWKKTFYHNPQHEITRIIENRPGGKEQEISSLEYDDNGRLATRTDQVEGVKGGRKTEYTYNESGNLISSKSYNATTPQNTTTTYYTPDGNKKLEITINGRSRSEKIYFYNERNDVSKITSVNGSKKEDTTFEYVYDEQGNWISRTQRTGADLSTTRRTIEYYNYDR